MFIIGKHTARRPAGLVENFNGTNRVDLTEADTLRCCHCAHHFVVKPGSGTRRGFCTKCNAVTCGDAGCDPCYAFERRLEDYEKGKLKILL